jgi:putative two-component system response regulator
MDEIKRLNSKGVVLIVDDERAPRKSLLRILSSEDYELIEAESGEAALEAIEKEQVDVVLLDIRMPGMDGIETCRRIRQLKDTGHVPVVFVTGEADRDIRIDGKDAGGDEFLQKPVDDVELKVRVRNLMLLRRYYQHLEQERESLERTVNDQNDLITRAMIELGKAKETVRRFNEEIIFRLSRAVEFRDDETGNHVQRMSRYCGLIASRMGMTGEMVEAFRLASALHDVGKIAIPDDILHKPGRLTDDEMSVMKKHAEKGYYVLTGSESSLLDLSATIANTHHERFDGKGYPNGLKGTTIPFEGRMAAVADVFDALTSKRCYKAAFSVEKAVGIIKEEKGTGFDPEIVDAFLDAMPEIENIMLVYADR